MDWRIIVAEAGIAMFWWLLKSSDKEAISIREKTEATQARLIKDAEKIRAKLDELDTKLQERLTKRDLLKTALYNLISKFLKERINLITLTNGD